VIPILADAAALEAVADTSPAMDAEMPQTTSHAG